MTQKQLAEATGVDRAYVSKAEKHGKAYPRHLALYARLFQYGGDPSDLLKKVNVCLQKDVEK